MNTSVLLIEGLLSFRMGWSSHTISARAFGKFVTGTSYFCSSIATEMPEKFGFRKSASILNRTSGAMPGGAGGIVSSKSVHVGQLIFVV